LRWLGFVEKLRGYSAAKSAVRRGMFIGVGAKTGFKLRRSSMRDRSVACRVPLLTELDA